MSIECLLLHCLHCRPSVGQVINQSLPVFQIGVFLEEVLNFDGQTGCGYGTECGKLGRINGCVGRLLDGARLFPGTRKYREKTPDLPTPLVTRNHCSRLPLAVLFALGASNSTRCACARNWPH